jgi:hypothetical protein
LGAALVTRLELGCALLSLVSFASLILAVIAGISRDRWKQRFMRLSDSEAEHQRQSAFYSPFHGGRPSVHPDAQPIFYERGFGPGDGDSKVVPFRRKPREPTGL